MWDSFSNLLLCIFSVDWDLDWNLFPGTFVHYVIIQLNLQISYFKLENSTRIVPLRVFTWYTAELIFQVTFYDSTCSLIFICTSLPLNYHIIYWNKQASNGWRYESAFSPRSTMSNMRLIKILAISCFLQKMCRCQVFSNSTMYATIISLYSCVGRVVRCYCIAFNTLVFILQILLECFECVVRLRSEKNT